MHLSTSFRSHFEFGLTLKIHLNLKNLTNKKKYLRRKYLQHIFDVSVSSDLINLCYLSISQALSL